MAIGGHEAPRAPAAAKKCGAIAPGRGRGWIPGQSQPWARCESRGSGLGRTTQVWPGRYINFYSTDVRAYPPFLW